MPVELTLTYVCLCVFEASPRILYKTEYSFEVLDVEEGPT